MAEFKVRWEIDVSADSLIGAAKRAQEIQLNPESIATFFDVKLHGNKHWFTIDLGFEKEMAKGYKPPVPPRKWLG